MVQYYVLMLFDTMIHKPNVTTLRLAYAVRFRPSVVCLAVICLRRWCTLPTGWTFGNIFAR